MHFFAATVRVLDRCRLEWLTRQQRLSEIEVSTMVESFTRDLVVETLREGCAFMEIQIAQPDGSDFPLLDAVLAFCERQNLMADSPAVALFFHVFRMLEAMPSGGSAVHFFEVKKLLTEQPTVPAPLFREAWKWAINFAICQQNLGNRGFGAQAFQLYKSGIEKGLILENGRLLKKAYSNTLVLALLVGEAAWAEDFLKNYRQFLPENERENTYQHNLATLFFKQKKFGKCSKPCKTCSSPTRSTTSTTAVCCSAVMSNWANGLPSKAFWTVSASGCGGPKTWVITASFTRIWSSSLEN